MKQVTKIGLLFWCLLVGEAVSGQHYVGVRAGYGGGSIRLYPTKDSKMIFGMPSAGISYKYYSATKYVGAIELDLQYIEKGYEYRDNKDSDTSYRRTIQSFELPFMWQPHFYLLNRHVRTFINLGVVLNYNVSSRYELRSARAGVLEKGPYEFSTIRDNRFGYGLCGGGGIGVLFGRYEMLLEARYYLGYSDILKNQSKYTSNPQRSPLDQLNISMGFYYRLGKGGILAPLSKKQQAKLENYGNGID